MYFPYGLAITVTSYEMDDNGDWTPTRTRSIGNCAAGISRLSVEKEGAFGDSTRADLTLFAPAESDITYTDRVTFPDGTQWDVWGYPADFASPFTGFKAGMQVPLRRFTG